MMIPLRILQRAAIFLALLSASMAVAEPSGKAFLVAHTMKYKGQVNLASYGLPSTPIIYESVLLNAERNAFAPLPDLRSLAKSIQAGPVPTVVDIERWPVSSFKNPHRDQNARKLIEMLAVLRQLRPDMQFGYYSVVPHRVYWPLVSKAKEKLEELEVWKQDNETAKADLATHLDALFPSLYTMYDDRQGWQLYATQTLLEARGFGKPIYCFLWPKFHDSNHDLKGHYLSREFWRLQLETCRRHADGIVIWNYEPDKDWDDEAPWWRETVDFLRQQASMKPGPKLP